MGDELLIFCFENIILFCFIFWGLTWAGEYFYKKKEQKAKKQFYECGFQVTNNFDINFNLNFLILCVFLILYDIEFALLIPFLTNLTNLMLLSYIILIVFIIAIILSLQYDWQMNALNWQY